MIARALLLVALLTVVLGGCAPALQGPAHPEPGFIGPRLEDKVFVAADGARLGLTRWDAFGPPRAVIVGVHGMDDYANTFHLAAPWWAARRRDHLCL